MKTFKVRIREIIYVEVNIEATSKKDAIQRAKRALETNEIVMDAGNCETKFKIVENK